MTPIERRQFLALLVGALAVPASASAADTDEKRPGHSHAASARWARALIINALGGLDNPNPPPRATGKAETPAGSPRAAPTAANPTPGTENATFDPRALREARASGLTAVNITIGYVAGDKEPFELSVRDIAQTDANIRAQASRLQKVLTAGDILRAKSEHRIGVIYGFQNAAMLGTDATRVDLFANLGVRVFQLTYNPANRLGDGSMAPANRGLTAFGREVVARLNANRVMVDLSHSGQQTCLEAARASKQPISINHTGCRALVDLPRNKTDEELRLVASRGGFVGIYFMPFLNETGHATAADVLAHLDHAVKVCGEDHVGIGTDGPVTTIDDLDAYRAVLAREIEARKKAGIGAKGEGPDTLPFVIDLRGVNQFYELADRLEQRGYTTARIEKILGLNFLAYAKQVWGS